jgi:hypothetical protein
MRHLRLIAAAIALVVFLPGTIHAKPEIIARKVVASCSPSGIILTVTLDRTTYNSFGQTLYYHIDPPSAGVSAKGTNPMVIAIPKASVGNHVLWISTSKAPTGGSSSANYPFVVPNCRKGMTWALLGTNVPTGTIKVGCSGPACNAYHGDTPCTTPLPLLCIRKSGPGFPLPVPASVDNSNRYYKWAGGIVGTTAAMVPPSTLAAANAACTTQFGTDWRVAEFHDGWGWHFQAYGGIGNPTQRFWAHINDQPAVCW